MELSPTKQKKSAKSKRTNFGKARKKKSKSNNPKPIYWARSWERLQTLGTNALLAQFVPTPNDYEEHFHTLSIDNIQIILALKKMKQYEGLDMTEEGISTEMIKLCINTLNSDTMTPDEEALGYFTWKKLKNLSTWERMESWRKETNWSIHDAMNVWRSNLSYGVTKECYYTTPTLAICFEMFRCAMVLNVL